MAVLQAILSTVILGILYYRMVKRETPSPVSLLQAITPIGLGIASLSVSFYAFLGVAILVNALGIHTGSAPVFIKSMLLAFMMAGGPEELTKLVFMIIAISRGLKIKRNCAAYGLIFWSSPVMSFSKSSAEWCAFSLT